MIPSKDFTLEFSKWILQLQLAAVHSAFRGKATFLTGIHLTAVFLRHSFFARKVFNGCINEALKICNSQPPRPSLLENTTSKIRVEKETKWDYWGSVFFFQQWVIKWSRQDYQAANLNYSFYSASYFKDLSKSPNFSMLQHTKLRSRDKKKKSYFCNTRSVGDKCSLTTRASVYPLDALGGHLSQGDVTPLPQRSGEEPTEQEAPLSQPSTLLPYPVHGKPGQLARPSLPLISHALSAAAPHPLPARLFPLPRPGERCPHPARGEGAGEGSHPHQRLLLT